jgi:hypothetical protein
MKDARTYERKIKKLLSGAKKKSAKSPSPPSDDDVLRFIIKAVFLADATEKEAEKAMSALGREFVDYNELRVAPDKEILECIGKEHPEGRTKAQTVNLVLGSIFNHINAMTIDYLEEMARRDVRRHLKELGMPPFAEALVAMTCFGIHAIPVDLSLLEVLQMNEMAHPESDVRDCQALLERVILQKDGPAAHEFLRGYVVKNAKALAKKRKEEAERRAAETEARRKAEEEAQRKAEEEAARKAMRVAEREARKAEREAAKLAKKKASKKKAVKKKAAKKTAKKPVKKTAKKAVKKAAKKRTKKKAKK